MSFADLGLSDELLRAVTEAGYSDPTPVQKQAIPSVLMIVADAVAPFAAKTRRLNCVPASPM